MIPALGSREGEEMIAQLAAVRGLLVFDFDGTLAPIVPDRGAAAMRPATRGLLRAAAVWYRSAVISGRARADVAARVSSAPLVAVIGEHGADLEGREPPGATVQLLARWTAALRAGLHSVPGISVEAKRWSIAIHYRAAPDPAQAAALAHAAADGLTGARVFGGHAVVNVVAPDAPTKGDALEVLARRHGARSVLYVGDDITDEDAFRSPAVTFAVRVGRSALSAARWFLEDQRHVDTLLRLLVSARTRQARIGEEFPAHPTPPQEDGP